jgi:hypothetical protein
MLSEAKKREELDRQFGVGHSYSDVIRIEDHVAPLSSRPAGCQLTSSE